MCCFESHITAYKAVAHGAFPPLMFYTGSFTAQTSDLLSAEQSTVNKGVLPSLVVYAGAPMWPYPDAASRSITSGDLQAYAVRIAHVRPHMGGRPPASPAQSTRQSP